MQVAIDIIEDYLIFGGTEFLSRHASSLATLLDGIIANVNDKGILSTLPIIEILVQVCINYIHSLLQSTSVFYCICFAFNLNIR